LDEITRSLDPGAAARLRRQILAEVAGRGAAVLFASHDLAEVQAIASGVLLLDQGHAARFGSFAQVRPDAERIFASPTSEAVR
jgi:ABC-2 type transport system ATP-binding protein